MWTRRAVLLSIPHAALCVSGRSTSGRSVRFLCVSMPHAALCVSGLCSLSSCLGYEEFQCRTQHCVCRDFARYQAVSVTKSFNAARSIVCVGTEKEVIMQYFKVPFQCRTQHYVCRDKDNQHDPINPHSVSMPHAALCVSGQATVRRPMRSNIVSMPHAALCVSGQEVSSDIFINEVSMPHAALCVSGLNLSQREMARTKFQCRTQHCVCRDLDRIIVRTRSKLFQCRTQHCVCRDEEAVDKLLLEIEFQCRTQHCVCRDSVSRSPCPARAEKAFWKDALFCAVFGVCG